MGWTLQPKQLKLFVLVLLDCHPETELQHNAHCWYVAWLVKSGYLGWSGDWTSRICCCGRVVTTVSTGVCCSIVVGESGVCTGGFLHRWHTIPMAIGKITGKTHAITIPIVFWLSGGIGVGGVGGGIGGDGGSGRWWITATTIAIAANWTTF